MLVAPAGQLKSAANGEVLVKYVEWDTVIASFHGLQEQTLMHMLNKAKVHSPLECRVTLVGKSLAQRHLLLPRIQPVHHGATLKQLCAAAPFPVHDIEISNADDPAPDPAPSPVVDVSVVTISDDSEDEAAGAPSRKRRRFKQKAMFVTARFPPALVRRASPQPAPASPQAARCVSPRLSHVPLYSVSPPAQHAQTSPVRARWYHTPPLHNAASLQYDSMITKRSPSPSYAYPRDSMSPLHRYMRASASYMHMPTSPSYAPPSYMPTSPSYIPASPSYQPASPSYTHPLPTFSPTPADMPADAAKSPPPSPDDIYECEGDCGWEGTQAEVEEHEHDCPAFRKNTTWWCDFGCGYAANYDEVHLHEGTCALRAGAATKVKGARKKRQTAPASIIAKSKPVAIIAKTGPVFKKSRPASILKNSKPAPTPETPPPPTPEKTTPSTKDDDKARNKLTREESLRAKQQRKKLLDAFTASTRALAKTLAEHTPKYYKFPAVPYEQVLLDSPEFRELEAEFILSADIIAGGHDFKVKKIFRIQDMQQNAKFQARRLMLKDSNPMPAMQARVYAYPQDVTRAWHGTEESTVEKIRATGMDRSASGGNGAALGIGTYFGSSVDLPLNGECGATDRYTVTDKHGYKHLILAAVILGHCVIGHSSMKVFPEGVQSTVENLDSFKKICSHADDNHLPLYHFVIETVKNKSHFCKK